MAFDPSDEMPELGPSWAEARALGVDTTLLLENLQRTPAERIQNLVTHNVFVFDVQSRTAPDVEPTRTPRK